jgi:hypothetical protein
MLVLFCRSIRIGALTRLMRGCAVPPPSDARGWPADDHVRDKRKQQCDDNCFGRIELAQHDDLVERIHHEPEKDDPGGRVQPFIQTLGALAWVTQHRPKIG